MLFVCGFHAVIMYGNLQTIFSLFLYLMSCLVSDRLVGFCILYMLKTIGCRSLDTGWYSFPFKFDFLDIFCSVLHFLIFEWVHQERRNRIPYDSLFRWSGTLTTSFNSMLTHDLLKTVRANAKMFLISSRILLPVNKKFQFIQHCGLRSITFYQYCKILYSGSMTR